MCLYPKVLSVKRIGQDYAESVTVSCGKCLECLQSKSTEWAHRIVDESKFYTDNCFITLTYDNEHLPVGGVLVRRDLQLFIKRLRKHIEPQRIRIFYCGEYGARGGRPHYHIIVFGWKPRDLFFLKKDDKGSILYRSVELEKIWTFGYSCVGDVTLETAKYCAKYLQKLNCLSKDKPAPFIGMSNRPGIGYNAIDPQCLSSDSIYHNGRRFKVPRYYLKVLERSGHDLTDFSTRRVIVGKMKENLVQLELRRKKAKEFIKKR